MSEAAKPGMSDRQMAEGRIGPSDQLFRAIFENAQIGISVFDVPAMQFHSNEALRRMLNCTHEDLSSVEKWDLVVHPDDRAKGANRYRDLVQGRRDADEYTQRLVHRDGQIVMASGKFTVIRDAEGLPKYVVALHEDITERKRVEQDRDRVTGQMRQILESTDQGVYGIGLRGECTFINRATCELIGYVPEDVLGRNMHELVHHHTTDGSPYPVEQCPIYRAFQKGEGCRVDAEVMWRRDGTSFPVEYSSLPIVENGKAIGAVVTVTDITERKAAEDLLRKRDEELKHVNFLAETALELARAGYWHVPLDGSGWYHASARRLEVFGEIPSPDFRYRLDELFAHAREADAEAAAAAEEAFNGAIEGKYEIYNTIFAYKRPIDGQIIWVHALGHVKKDPEGKPTDIYGVSQDITEFKRLEAELLRAKEEAVAATMVKSEFLANMSHEIRTPMNAVLGMTHLALKTELTTRQRGYLTKTQAAAEALLGIINDILDFSKIEAGKLTMEHTEFHLDVVLDNLTSIVGTRAQEKSLEFLVDANQDLPPVLVGDPLRLGQVLSNLISNALKFTDRGEILVTASLEEKLTDRVKLKFTVHDSGIGMTPDQTARLFQPFSQADTSTTRKYGGTGLGLSISKRLVEMMGGNIWVESEYGRGSTFCFTAWLGVGAVDRYQKTLPPGLADTRVLVVDDNSTARLVLMDLLRQFTFRVECSPSGSDALQELARADARDPYQLVLMDWQMPGLDGLETSRRIRRGGNLNHVPKILLLGLFGREDLHLQSEEMDIDAFLQKPISPSILFDTLMNLFRDAAEEKTTPTEKRDRDLALARGVRVLLVEDNEVNQQIAAELLESEGAEVTIANHGGEAVRLLLEGAQPPSFDLVLMDLQMPAMDGLTATMLLRRQPQLRHLPIIAMTAHAMAEEVQHCLDVGMNDHIGKPIDPRTFFSTIARWTNAARQRDPGASTRPASGEGERVFPEIEGVDVAAGLERAAGNTQLYRDLLKQFAARQGSTAGKIATAIQTRDRNQVERLAHSLRGAAGNLGIMGIFRLAASLEKAARDSLDGVEGNASDLAAALNLQIQTIQSALRPGPFTAENRGFNRSADASAVMAEAARLRALLEASDADALLAFASLAELIRGATEPSLLEGLGVAVKNFDFETALVRLNEIEKEFEANQKRG